MATKLTTVFLKKEAEAYSAQGLHKEALKVYQELLSSTPNLTDSFKSMIQTQIASIEKELGDDYPQEEVLLSASEIKCIKEGWGASVPEGDVLVCAEAFCRVGHHLDAFQDVVKLLKKGVRTEKVMEIFADCLAHLNTPSKLLNSLNTIIKKISSRPKDRLRLYLLTTEAMVARNQPLHSYVLYRYLKNHPVLSKKAPKRINIIAKGIKELRVAKKNEVKQNEMQRIEAEVLGSDFEEPKVPAQQLKGSSHHGLGDIIFPPPYETSKTSSTGLFATIKRLFKRKKTS